MPIPRAVALPMPASLRPWWATPLPFFRRIGTTSTPQGLRNFCCRTSKLRRNAAWGGPRVPDGHSGIIRSHEQSCTEGGKHVMAKSSASAGSPSSKSLLFMMIAMTVGFCILLGGGMLMASRVISVLGLRSSSDKKTVRTPLGEFRYEKAKEVGPGLAAYPGASLLLPGDRSGNVPASDEQPQ